MNKGKRPITIFFYLLEYVQKRAIWYVEKHFAPIEVTWYHGISSTKL